MNCLAVIIRFLSNLFVYPVLEMNPLPEDLDPGDHCICGHNAIDHKQRSSWCQRCTCAYPEPMPIWWVEFDPEVARAEYESRMTETEAA